MKTYLNKKGFTLVEVLLATILFVVVIALAYNIYFFSIKAFETADTQVNLQSDMRIASNYISNELRTAYEVRLASTIDEDNIDGTFHLIYSEDGVIKKKYRDLENDEIVERIILDSRIDGLNFDVSYGKADDKKNVVEFEILAEDKDYSIKSSMIAHNMGPNQEIEGEPGSRYMYYAKTAEIEGADEAEPIPRRCLTKIVLNDSYSRPAVILLRNFRDIHMMANAEGKKIVSFYYEFSAKTANFVENNELLKLLARIFLIPFILLAAVTTVSGGYIFLIYTIIEIILIRILWVKLQKRLKVNRKTI